MEPVSWSFRDDSAEEPFPPAVLMGCTRGICARTEVVMPKPRARKVPAGMTPEQFQALKGGAYWPEIVNV